MEEILTKLDCTNIVVEDFRVTFTFMEVDANIMLPSFTDDDFMKHYLTDCVVKIFAKIMKERVNECK